MTVGIAVKERILHLCEERGLSVNKLATISGVTQSTVNNSKRQINERLSRAQLI